jgi:hypothetical protein
MSPGRHAAPRAVPRLSRGPARPRTRPTLHGEAWVVCKPRPGPPSLLLLQGTPEASVAYFCELARQSGEVHARAAAADAAASVRQPVLV